MWAVTKRAIDLLRANVERRLIGDHVAMPRGAQAELAERTGIDPGQISLFLKGEKALGWEAVDALASYFRCQISDLFAPVTHSSDRRKLSSGLSSSVTASRGKTTTVTTPSPIGGGYGSFSADTRVYELEETIRHVLIEGRDLLEQCASVLDPEQVRATARRAARARKVSGSRRHGTPE